MAVAVISIDQLTAASSANAGDQIPASQSGSTVRLSVGMINAAITTTQLEQMGPAGVAEFRRMLAALHVGDYELAAAEMLDSKWALEVGNRAQELAAMIRTGSYQ